jgi:hypothetical protein
MISCRQGLVKRFRKINFCSQVDNPLSDVIQSAHGNPLCSSNGPSAAPSNRNPRHVSERKIDRANQGALWDQQAENPSDSENPSMSHSLNCTFVRETDAAVCVIDHDSGEEVWLPLSQVESMHRDKNNIGKIVITERYMAIAKERKSA